MSFPTILRRSLPTWLVWAVPLGSRGTGAVAEPRAAAGAAHRGRCRRRPRRGRRRRGIHRRRRELGALGRLLDRAQHLAPAPRPACRRRPCRVGERGRERLRRRRLRRRPEPAQDGVRARQGRDVAAPPRPAGRACGGCGCDRRRQALRPRRRRRPARARPRGVRARPEEPPLDADPGTLAARASRGRRSGRLASTPSAAGARGSTRTRAASRSTTRRRAAGRGWPRSRWRAAARAPPYANGRIVSIGGERPQGTIAAVYAYELRTKRWRRLADLPTPRHGLGVVARRGPRSTRSRAGRSPA